MRLRPAVLFLVAALVSPLPTAFGASEGVTPVPLVELHQRCERLLVAATRSPTPGVRQVAHIAPGVLAGMDAIVQGEQPPKWLEEGLRDADPRVRVVCVQGLPGNAAAEALLAEEAGGLLKGPEGAELPCWA